MGRTIRLSIVDQSPVRKGGTAADALRETIELAAAAEALGYRRYWLAEHHNLANFAGTSPEILIGQIAARTSKIRVGSGGVMLTHYSAFKVAENFRMLETLYPGRIDLGIGRAPGSDQMTAAALSYPRHPNDVRHYRGAGENGAGDDRKPQRRRCAPREELAARSLCLDGHGDMAVV